MKMVLYFLVGATFLALFFLVKDLRAFPVSKPAQKAIPSSGISGGPYADFINMSSRTWGVESALIKAIIRQESNFNANAVSVKKCYGLMQISLMVCEDFGYVKEWTNPTSYELSRIMDPQNNINIGTRQLSNLLSSYQFDTAVQMYNVGVDGFLNHGYRAADYLSDVKGFYNAYKQN
jgi:soluble lytic murein transglycosylase-like protein